MKKKLISLIAGMCLLTTTFMPAATPVYAADSPDTKSDPEIDSGITDDIRDACKGKYVNIALVVDTTGSMYYDIQAVKENLKAFITEIKDTGAIPRVSLIEYRDTECDEETTVHYTDSKAAWYESVEIEKLITEIENLEAFGGGDTPESLVDALGFVLDDDTMLWNKDAAKFAIVLTDAPYKVTNSWGYESMDDVITLLAEKDIKTTVITHKDTFEWDMDITLEEVYSDLVTKTKGTMIDMTDSFGDDLITYAEKIIADTAKVEVDSSYIPVTSIKLGEGEKTIATDAIYSYSVTVEPADATVKEILWSVEDEEIAVINTELTRNGFCVLNAKSTGTTTLVARTKDGGYTAYFTITISDIVTTDGVSTTAKIDKVSDILADKTTGVTKAILRTTEENVVIEKDVLKDIFDLAKTNSKEIAFSFTDDSGSELYSWTFDGKTITDTSKGISSFKIDIDAKSEDLDEKSAADVKDIETTLKDVEKEVAHFENSGELPGTASIKIKTSLTDTEDLHVYYYNPADKTYELIDAKAPVVDGYVTFDINHCSDYVITNVDIIKFLKETTTEEPTTVEDAPVTPGKTADNATSAMPVYAALIFAAAGAIVLANRKKAENE